jgi:hypothetical protein
MAAVADFRVGQIVEFTDGGDLVQGIIEAKYFEDTTMMYVVKTGPYHVTLVEGQYLTPISAGGGRRTKRTKRTRKSRLNRRKGKTSRKYGGEGNPIQIRNPLSLVGNVSTTSPLTTPKAMQEEANRQEALLRLVGRQLPMKLAGNIQSKYNVWDIVDFEYGRSNVTRGFITKVHKLYQSETNSREVSYDIYIPMNDSTCEKLRKSFLQRPRRIPEQTILGKVGHLTKLPPMNTRYKNEDNTVQDCYIPPKWPFLPFL